MSEPREPKSPSELVRWAGPVFRRWQILLLSVTLCGLAGYVYHARQPGTFESSTRVLVSKKTASMADRRMGGEDSVATMVHIATSDEVLGQTARLLWARPADAALAVPLPDSQHEAVDWLKLGLQAIPSRDSGVAGGSSVLTLKYVSGNPDDCRRVLETVLEAVQWYLNARYSATREQQLRDLDATAAALLANRTELHVNWVKRKGDLADVTTEDLSAVRGRVSGHRQMLFNLQLEQSSLDRELATVAEVGTDPTARQAKLRQLLGVTRLPADGTDPPEESLAELTARRTDLAARLLPGHPRLAHLDAQIQFYRALNARAAPEAKNEDELARYEAVLKERRRANAAQLEVVKGQAAREESALRVAVGINEEVEVLRRQLDETTVELNRLADRRASLTVGQGTDYEVRDLDRPRTGRQTGPRLVKSLLPALFCGFLLAAAVAHLMEYLHRGFRTPDDIQAALGVTVLGHIPTLPAAVEDPSLCHVTLVAARPRSLHAEHFRGLRANLLAAVADKGRKVLLVTSPTPGDGKSTVAANLAASLARTGKRVLLVDADFRKPEACRLFGLADPEAGMTGLLQGTATLEEAIIPVGLPNLWLLPAGMATDVAADQLSGAVFATAVDVLKLRYDYVVIDSPPLFLVSDAMVLARKADGVLLVFRLSRRCRPETERAIKQLAAVGAEVLGVVVNGADGATAGLRAVEQYKGKAFTGSPVSYTVT